MKFAIQTSMLGVVLSLFSACSGSINDGFFQIDDTKAGVVCIDGIKIPPGGAEATVIVARVKQYYGSSTVGSFISIR